MQHKRGVLELQKKSETLESKGEALSEKYVLANHLGSVCAREGEVRVKASVKELSQKRDGWPGGRKASQPRVCHGTGQGEGERQKCVEKGCQWMIDDAT